MLANLVIIISIMRFAEATEFPNGTDIKINFFSCNPEVPISVSSIEFFDRQGLPMYPIKVNQLAFIKMSSFNNGNDIEENRVNVTVHSYVKNNGQWMWKNIIPTKLQNYFLSNIDGCKMAHNCPLKHGDLNLTLPLELYKYKPLLYFIDKTIAHQFVVRMRDHKTSDEISCETVQFKLI